MEKIQINPLEIVANHEIETNDVKRLISKLQSTQQKGDKLGILLEELYDILLGIARLIARNIHLGVEEVL